MTVRHRIVLSAVSACLVAAAVTGCAQSPSDFDSSVAASLQAATEKVRTDAAGGHYASALQELQNIESEANDAATQGKLSAARKQDVLAALALVRADLEALMGSRSTPTATPSTPGTPTKSKKKEKSPEPSPVQDQEDS